MIKPIACIDASVCITILDTTGDTEIAQQQTYIELTIESLNKQGARWIVPAPAVAELCKDGPGSEQVRELVKVAFRRLRVEVLDEDAADVAGQISRMALQSRQGRERGAVKYDALIAAIAHKINARWLLTANPSDMRSALNTIGSRVEVIDPTSSKHIGQQVMVSVLNPGVSG